MNLTEFRVARRITKSETIVQATSALDAWKQVTGSSSGYRAVKEGSGWTIYSTSIGVGVGRVMEV